MTGTVDERLAAALLYHNVHETIGAVHCSGYCASDIAAALADSGVVLVEREARKSRLSAAEQYAIQVVLDRPYADPDDDAATAARAAVRLDNALAAVLRESR